MLDSVSGHRNQGFWSDLFRYCGYLPVVSQTTGPARAIIGALGTTLNAIALPIIYLTGDKELTQTKDAIKGSAGWCIRGILETKPLIGNGIVWSIDSLYDRIRGVRYQSGTLNDLRFFPGVSIVSGAIRSWRGVCGAIVGTSAKIFQEMHSFFSGNTKESLKKMDIAHTFILESLYEIPQGLIEMIPLCNTISPVIAMAADKLEQKKIALWKRPSEDGVAQPLVTPT